MLTERAVTICLYEILRDYSDESHIMPMREIIAKMSALYDLKPDRRTLYSAIELLCFLGYDISLYKDNKVGYYLITRPFEPSQVKLLTDAVCSFPFIPAKQSEELINKLQNTQSKHYGKRLRNLRIVRGNIKTNNKEVFRNIELLDEAITLKQKVSFTYMEYRADKKLYPRRNESYKVNPYGMVYLNEHYYLICNLDTYPNLSLYRIDLIKDIALLEEKADKRENLTDQIESAVYAFTGAPENIVMHCDNVILGDVIDKFGTDILISRLDEQTFAVCFRATAYGIKFWALQYLPYVEVIEPKWLRDEVVESIKNNKYTQ